MPDPDLDKPTLPDDTRHGPVPPLQPTPRPAPDPGRHPVPNPDSPGDNPVRPPGRDPFPEGEAIEE